MNTLENNLSTSSPENSENKLIQQTQKTTKEKKQRVLDLNFQEFKFLRSISKNGQNYIAFDFTKLPDNEPLNNYFIELIDFITSKDFYIKGLSNLKIGKYRLLDILYKANFKKNHLGKNSIILGEIISCHEDKYLPQVKSKNGLEFCELEFKLGQKYNIDEVIANLWNGGGKPKNGVKLGYNYNALILTIKFCNGEFNTDEYLKSLAKYCLAGKNFKTVEEIKLYLQNIGFLKFVGTNLSIRVASSIPAKNGENSAFEIKSKNVLLDVAPKGNNTHKKIDMYVYGNTTFNVSNGEVLLLKHPATNGTTGFKLNGEKILPKNGEDKLNLEKIVGNNIKIIPLEDGKTQLISEIDGFLIGFDATKPQNKFYVDTKKELKGGVNMRTGIVNDEVDGDRDIKGNIETDYTFIGKELTIKGDIETGKNLLISGHNKSSVTVKIDGTVYSANIFCQSPGSINIKKLASNSFIYAPFADIEIQEVQFGCVIIAKNVHINKSINHELILSSKTKIDELEAGSKIITSISKEMSIEKVNGDESSKLELYCHYSKIKNIDIGTIKLEILNYEQNIRNIISKNTNLALLNQYYRYLELQKITDKNTQDNLEFAKLKDLVAKFELDEDKVEQLKFMTRSAQTRIDEINNKINEAKKLIKDYQKLLDQNRQIHIGNIYSGVPIFFGNIQRNILKEISKDIKIAGLKYCKNTKEIILDMLKTIIEDIKRGKDEDYKQRVEKKSSNYDLHFK